MRILHCYSMYMHETCHSILTPPLLTFLSHFWHRVIFGPEKMIMVPPRHYCIVENPAQRGDDGQVIVDKLGQVKLSHADQEIRLAQEPFPLYPGEVLKQVRIRKFIRSPLLICHFHCDGNWYKCCVLTVSAITFCKRSHPLARGVIPYSYLTCMVLQLQLKNKIWLHHT